jgi:dinuclear metal center YbgI/SA1388 family protein
VAKIELRNGCSPFNLFPMPRLDLVCRHLDRYLQIGKIHDSPRALNGLQVENCGKISRIGAAVDSGIRTIEDAIERKVDLLLVHHGLFWRGTQPIVGPEMRKLRLLIEHNIAIYSAHLPLDLHPVAGNNILLFRAMGFSKPRPFFFEKDQYLGLQTRTQIARTKLVERLQNVLSGNVHLCAGGPDICRRIGIVTGGAGAEIERAAREGVDTFITGEGPHWSYISAEDLGVNILYGGHYATEMFGVKALADHLSRKFKLPWEFLDHPTGL